MSLRRSIRKYMLAGLIVIAPVTATAIVLVWIFELLDGLIGRWIYPLLPVPIPGLGLLALVLLLLIVGWAASRAVGGRIVAAWNRLLERLPVTRRIHGAANRIVRTLLGTESRPFQTVVLIEYPADGRWSVGFLSGPAPAVISRHVPDSVAVFVPTTPNPTSGWVVIVPRSHTIALDMTVDEAFTYVLSAGSVRFDEIVQQAAVQTHTEAK